MKPCCENRNRMASVEGWCLIGSAKHGNV
jgi:hypothetical protein